MVKQLDKMFEFIKKYFLAIVISVYLLITLPALLDSNHFLYNLEPYPDGLLYALSGKNFWLGGEAKLITPFGELNNWVPPLYSLVLGLGALIFSIPTSFYLTNILIQVLTLSIFYWILKTTTKNSLSKILGMLGLLSHWIFFWLPSSPLTENISLLFLVTMIASFFIKDWKKYLVLGIGALGLLFTRSSNLPLVVAGILIPLFIFFRKLSVRKRIMVSLFTAALLSLTLWFLSFQNISVLRFTQMALSNESDFFAIRFALPHLSTYLKMLLFSKGLFLWLNIGLTNFIFFGLFLASIVVLWKKKQKNKSLILTFLFLAQLPLQLVFYVADARYLIYSIPLIILGTTWLIDALPKKQQLLIPLALIGVILQLFLQRTLIKQVLVDNLLGRSTAWQYEAVKHFDSVLTTDDLLITALPPFLVDTYQVSSYRTLPLSNNQEFIAKKQYLWGEDINYEDLHATYDQWLIEGKIIYISNAYITHLQSVIKDYEKYKEEFEFILIEEGCLGACNIYQLEKK